MSWLYAREARRLLDHERQVARAQDVKRRQQLFRTFFINQIGQQYDERTPLAVCRDKLESVRIRRLDHFRLDGVQGFERGFDVIAPATRRQVALDPAAKDDETSVIAGARRR